MMLRKFMMLQLFANDTNPDNPNPENPNPDNPDNPNSENPKPGETEKEKPEQKPGAKYTDDDLDKILASRFARWKEDQEKAVNAAKEEAAKLAKMNTEQKQQYALEKEKNRSKELEGRIAELEKEAMRSELSKKAAVIMKEQHNIVATPDMLDFVVGDDADQTNKRIEKLVGIILEDRKQVETARATGRTPKSYDNGKNAVSEIEKRIAKYK